MLLNAKPLYSGIALRHKIFLEFDKVLTSLPTKTADERDAALSAQELADRIGVLVAPVQLQIDYLLAAGELEHLVETPIVHPLRYLLTIPGAAAIADEKYPSMVRRLKNEVLDARWRTATGWLAAIALLLSVAQLWESNSLEDRIYPLEQRIIEAAGKSQAMESTIQSIDQRMRDHEHLERVVLVDSAAFLSTMDTMHRTMHP